MIDTHNHFHNIVKSIDDLVAEYIEEMHEVADYSITLHKVIFNGKDVTFDVEYEIENDVYHTTIILTDNKIVAEYNEND